MKIKVKESELSVENARQSCEALREVEAALRNAEGISRSERLRLAERLKLARLPFWALIPEDAVGK